MDNTKENITEEQVTAHIRWLDQRYDEEMDSTRELINQLWDEVKILRRILLNQQY